MTAPRGAGREVQVAVADGVAFAGAVQDGRLTDLLAEPAGAPSLAGAVFLGRVDRTDAAAGAAWVEIGVERPAFLPLRAGAPPAVAGQALVVQAAGAARPGKHVEVTADVALPGRFLVHTPRAGGLAVSRKLPEAARRRWREALDGGWIVRRAAEAAPAELVQAEADFLAAAWRSLEARAAESRPPVRLAAGPGPARRLLHDLAWVEAVRVADPAQHRALLAWARAAAPDLGSAIRAEPVDLLDAVPALLDREVPLPSGGRLVIEPTEALTAVDVDSGSDRDRHRVNLEAARALAAQLRLRNIGGIVAIDFITTRRPEARARILDALRSALADDPAEVTLSPAMSPLGLVELARRRRGPALAEMVSPHWRGM